MQDEERQDDVQEPEAREPEGHDPGPEVEGAEEMAAVAEDAAEAEAADAPDTGAEDAADTADARPEDAADRPDARAEDAAPAEPTREPKRKGKKEDKEEVIPGAHLEPDLVLEEERDEAALPEAVPTEEAPVEEPAAEAGPEPEPEEPEPEPAPRKAMDLAADARYQATGKRKTAVARVILRPGSGTYQVNGRALDQHFPRIRLQRVAKQPLETVGYQSQMDVVAKIHGGGVSAQAGALRHGIARALVEADPSLRVELKRRGFLTRDPREKERKKAGLKKARKRPQFSKR